MQHLHSAYSNELFLSKKKGNPRKLAPCSISATGCSTRRWWCATAQCARASTDLILAQPTLCIDSFFHRASTPSSASVSPSAHRASIGTVIGDIKFPRPPYHACSAAIHTFVSHNKSSAPPGAPSLSSSLTCSTATMHLLFLSWNLVSLIPIHSKFYIVKRLPIS
jgi:hypothetical protein